MGKVTPIDEEYVFKGSSIICQTDLNGKIIFVNRKFREASGYELQELINSNLDIIRHPDMPDSIFTKMSEILQSGQSWNGLVKNLRKDGLYYWVDTEIIPVTDDNQKIVGYISVSNTASRKDIEENQQLYNKMLQEQGK